MGLMKIDINSDLGEASTREQMRREASLMRFITCANIACGFHAGDPLLIDRTIRLAKRQRLTIGAHPSYPDREHFGRRSMTFPPEKIELLVLYQLGAFGELASKHGVKVSHVKPHGALYNDAARDRKIAHAIVMAVARFSRDVILVGLAGSTLIREGRREYLKVAAEAFADRVYNPDGSLRSRKLKGALIEDPEKAAAQALSIVLEKKVTAFDGSRIKAAAQTICIHGDTPNAPAIALAVRKRLTQAGIEIAPLGSW